MNIVAPPGAQVTLDGVAVRASAFTQVGGSSWRVARVRLNSTREAHELRATAPVGLLVYGCGVDTSYMYPGGLSLRSLTP